MKRTIRSGLLVLLCMAIFVAGAAAQSGSPRQMPPARSMDQDDPDMPPPGGPGFGGGMPGGQGRDFAEFRMKKMIEMLELNEQQQKIMRDLFDNQMKELRDIEAESRTLTDQLVPLVKEEKRDDAKIGQILSQLDVLDARRDQVRLKFKAEADKSLTVVQRAKLRIFLQRFERQMIQKVRGMHDRRGPRGPMMPPSGQDDDREH